MEWLVAVSIKSAGQWLEGWAQMAALSTFAGPALARSQFRQFFYGAGDGSSGSNEEPQHP